MHPTDLAGMESVLEQLTLPEQMIAGQGLAGQAVEETAIRNGSRPGGSGQCECWDSSWPVVREAGWLR